MTSCCKSVTSCCKSSPQSSPQIKKTLNQEFLRSSNRNRSAPTAAFASSAGTCSSAHAVLLSLLRHCRETRPKKRVARNGSAYTWGQFRTFYGLRGRAEWEWAHAPALVRRGPGNSISGPVMTNAERIVQDMHDWYNAQDLEQPLDEVFRQLQNILFKNVIAPCGGRRMEAARFRRRFSAPCSG